MSQAEKKKEIQENQLICFNSTCICWVMLLNKSVLFIEEFYTYSGVDTEKKVVI